MTAIRRVGQDCEGWSNNESSLKTGVSGHGSGPQVLDSDTHDCAFSISINAVNDDLKLKSPCFLLVMQAK